MVVYILESAPQRLRGTLSRWCLEIRAGLFVGRVDAKMRELLWQKITDLARQDTNAVMVWREPSEQGFAFRSIGRDRREAVMVDGLWLVEYLSEARLPGTNQNKKRST